MPGRSARVVLIQRFRFEALEPSADRHPGALDFGDQLRSGHAAPRELGIPVADVAGATEPRADVVLDVASQMERQGPGGVGQPRDLLPDLLLVGIRLQLAPERAEVAVEYGRDVGGEVGRIHCGLRTI